MEPRDLQKKRRERTIAGMDVYGQLLQIGFSAGVDLEPSHGGAVRSRLGDATCGA
jgi:hypothetical protein